MPKPNQPARQQKSVLSIRVSPAMDERLNLIKTKLDTQSASEICRRALAWYARCLEAEHIEIVSKDGQKHRAKLY